MAATPGNEGGVNPPSGSVPTSFAPWLFGMILVSIPVIVLDSTGNQNLAWWYVALIILSVAFFYNQEIASFIGDLSSAGG